MTTKGDGIHVYGTPDPDNPSSPAKGGMRGERSPDQAEADGDTGGNEEHGTPGGEPPEPVEDRPNVSQVTPEDYPIDQRARGET